MLITKNRISAVAIVLSCITLAPSCLYAKNKKIHTRQKKETGISVGIKAGSAFSNRSFNSLKNITPTLTSHSVYLNKKIAKKLKVEAAIEYNTFPKMYPWSENRRIGNQYEITTPVTAQYYLLPENHKIQLFCGVGLLFGLNGTKNNSNTKTGDIINPQAQTVSLAGTKYINIIFTQGVQFEINTKIQITESIHFIPDGNNKTIGIDLGLGYKLP